MDQTDIKGFEKKIDGLNLKILLAEDNPVNQKVIQAMLEKRRISVDLAENGEQVLEKLKQKTYDLILMDVRMPNLDGIETTKIIRHPLSDITDKKIPIIALTALAMQEDITRCLNAGMDAYLSKPVLPKKLMSAVADILKIT